jgi:hypothetical protein
MTVPPKEAREIITEDPCVQAGMIVGEIYSCHCFPAASLPAL